MPFSAEETMREVRMVAARVRATRVIGERDVELLEYEGLKVVYREDADAAFNASGVLNDLIEQLSAAMADSEAAETAERR